MLVSCLCASHAFQEWAAKALGVRLCFVAGEKKPASGDLPIYTFPETMDKLPIIWLWSHYSVDGEGKSAEHFDYICEEGDVANSLSLFFSNS